MELRSMSLQQLEQLRKQTEDEVNVFTSNFNDLKLFQSKFAGSIAALDDIGAAMGGEETLIPLTSSLYIPGRLVKDAEILVDVGAGFFVGRSAADAKEILNRKVAYLKANTDSMMKVISVRQNNLIALREEIDERRQQMAAQGGGGAGAEPPKGS